VGAYGYTVNGQHWIRLPGLASFRFGRAGQVTALSEPHAPVDVIEDAFRRVVLPMALQARGQELLHASAVLTPSGVVALCAHSETGKSTMAYGLSRRGYPLWADDAVAFERAESGPRTIALPFEIQLHPDASAFYRQDPLAWSRRVRRSKLMDEKTDRAPLAGLIILDRVPDESEKPVTDSVRLSPTDAFLALLTHAYCFDPQDVARKRRMMVHYLDLIKERPVFEFRFQSGLEKLPVVLERIERVIDQCQSTLLQ
jgi:hypothetical protein